MNKQIASKKVFVVVGIVWPFALKTGGHIDERQNVKLTKRDVKFNNSKYNT